MSNKFVVSLDFGGTWIRAALIHKELGIIKMSKRLTLNSRPADIIVTDIVETISDVRGENPLEIIGVAIGVPTTFNDQGMLDPCINLPTMNNYPLKSFLEEKIQVPVRMENDARCFALGEWHLRKKEKFNTLVGITIGTSIGIGIVLNGKLYKGASGQSGEIWRSPVSIDPNETEYEIVDSMLSGKTLSLFYEQITGEYVSGEDLSKLAGNGDTTALHIFNQFGVSLAKTLSWIINFIDPDLIVLGGSVSKDLSYIRSGFKKSPYFLRDNIIVQSIDTLKSSLHGASELVF